ncbi:hypothetical protein KF840_16370 [bacterium]|nr:hypothetical protein [bacterium]
MAMRIGGRWVGAWALLAGAVLLPAGARAATPRLAVLGDTGLRGGTVSVVIRLSGDDGAAVSASLDIDFPTDLVAFQPPVKTTCAIAPRLAATHALGGRLPREGRVTVEIYRRTGPSAPPPLGDGDLATCDFQILADAMDSPAPLTIAFSLLGDATGHELPVTPVDGAIVISDAPNQPTPSPTPTAAPRRCVADCSGDGVVAVNEVILAVNIALGNLPLAQCPTADANGDGAVTIGELIEAVNDVISGC